MNIFLILKIFKKKISMFISKNIKLEKKNSRILKKKYVNKKFPEFLFSIS